MAGAVRLVDLERPPTTYCALLHEAAEANLTGSGKYRKTRSGGASTWMLARIGSAPPIRVFHPPA